MRIINAVSPKILFKILLFRLYSYLPYAVFVFFACCYIYSEVAWGGISWQNPDAPYATGYEAFNPFADIILVLTTIGLLSLPFILLTKLITGRSSGWRKWLPAIISYSLYTGFILLSGYMGWWID
jgi:hypothetical protein